MANIRLIAAVVLSAIATAANSQVDNNVNTNTKIDFAPKDNMELIQEWDKTFPKSDKVTHSKVTFVNRYGITLAADMYVPKTATGKLAAIAVCGPFGAVKEQSSGLYAQQMAERGFLTIAFDPSFTGESGGTPRYMTSPDINTEDFSAAVDYLVNRPDVDSEKVGIIGICGWGGHKRSLNSNGGRNATSPIPWINFPLMSRAGEIENAVMIIHGEKAHSFYFGSDAYKKLTVIPGKENNKLFMVIPGASHTDLYDQLDIIPFNYIQKFFNENLK